MVESTEVRGETAGNKRSIEADDLQDGTSLRSDDFVEVARVQGSNTSAYFHGFGDDVEDNRAMSELDLQATNDGGSTYEQVTGKARLMVYEDENAERPKAFGNEYSLRDLRESINEARRDKTKVPFQNPGTDVDEVLVWEIKTDSAYDGYVLSSENSQALIPFAEVPR